MSGKLGPGRTAGKPAGPAVPESGNGGRSLQCRPLFWPRVLCLPSHFILLLPPLSCRRSSQQTVSPLSSGLRGSGTRGGGAGAVGLLPVSLARVWQGVWPGCGPSPLRWEFRPRGEERGVVGVLRFPPTTFSNFTLTLGAYLGQGELHGGQPEKGAPGAGCVCMGFQKVCILSNSSLLSPQPPGAGNVASPTALALAEDSRHGKP